MPLLGGKRITVMHTRRGYCEPCADREDGGETHGSSLLIMKRSGQFDCLVVKRSNCVCVEEEEGTRETASDGIGGPIRSCK